MYNQDMKILVVEDEHSIAQSIKKGLEQETYAVDLAYTGNDGLDLGLSNEYDLILLDLLLPGISGIEVCKALRKKDIHTPVLILTAKGQVQDKIGGLDAGADDYLTKPFSFEELLARIRALTRRPKLMLNTVLTVGNLELNTNTYEVKREGKEIMLSHKEFALLQYLMRHAGKVLSKETLMLHVWNYDSDILPNTVEVYIRNLRNKIDIPFAKNSALIQTVRGFGYKLEPILKSSFVKKRGQRQ